MAYCKAGSHPIAGGVERALSTTQSNADGRMATGNVVCGFVLQDPVQKNGGQHADEIGDLIDGMMRMKENHRSLLAKSISIFNQLYLGTLITPIRLMRCQKKRRKMSFTPHTGSGVFVMAHEKQLSQFSSTKFLDHPILH